MFIKYFRFFSVIVIVSLLISSCNMPVAQANPTSAPELPSATAVPPSATVPPPSDTPVPDTATPTLTSLPSDTPTPAPTDTPTLPPGVLPSETPSPTLEAVIAEVMKETNCRTGPAGNYTLVATYQAGTRLMVVARDLGGGFIFVQNPEKPEEQCYVLSNNVKQTGDASVLPQYTPPASPTAAPSFTAKFKNDDNCRGQVFYNFLITNTGSLPFRSAYIAATNLKNNETVTRVTDAFDQYTGCIIAKNVSPLEIGQTAYLATELFKKDPRGEKVRVVIQVCTEKALKGECKNVVIEVKN